MKKLWQGIAATAAVGMLVAGCSDPGTGDEPAAGTDDGATTDEQWPDPTADLSGVTLSLWAAQSSATLADQPIAAFEEATGATVEVVTIPDPYEQGVQTRVATGDLPDLAFWQPTSSMLTAINASTNLQPLDGAPWIEEMDPELQDLTGILDDTRYAALITSPAVMGVYYNKDVFEEAGITETPGDFDEMVEIARDLDEQGTTPFFEMAGDRWGTQWWVQVLLADAAADGLWDRINTGEEQFTDEAGLTAIQTYKDLIDEGLFNEDIATATFEEQGDALLAGDAAMAVQINALYGQLVAKADAETVDETIGFFPISPSGNVGTSIPDQANALAAFATGDEAQEAAARQFMAFLMGPNYGDFIADQQTVSLKGDVPTPDGVPQVLQDVHASLGDSVGSMQSEAVANPDLYLYVSDMIQGGQMTPEDVATATQDHFAQLAQAQGVDGF
ncbi:ABC transporter substrate-binding protein [Actinotalea sp. C106]|uniref:ABC transporter substrate-binding protein n=1 Tax=Actinotalea sp. C106 TaxID=2908644 RepID=UPI002027ADD1|nr:extracellular solute-binding protein [Actinotalea sp. C106]